MNLTKWRKWTLWVWLIWCGLMGGILLEKIRTNPIIANYEDQIDLVVKQRDKAKSELATFQAILKQLVDGELNGVAK